MRRITCYLLVATSWLALCTAQGAVRPRYGGVLHVQVQSPLTSLDTKQSGSSQADAIARQRILPLIFETLVTVDSQGRAHPCLAIAWQSDLSFRRWQFYLRPGVRFQDGSLLSAATVSQSFASSHPAWTTRVESDTVVIESETPQPGLLAELALLRNAILRRGANEEWLGTGPFRIVNWRAGKVLELAANESCWAGRPFLDTVQIELAKSPRDQMLAFQLGKADLIELEADQLSRASDTRGAHVSLPLELLALVAGSSSKAEDSPVREALSLAIDRQAMQNALLRGGSEPTGSVLPEWISGKTFLFPTQVDTARARQLLAGVKRTAPLTLSYESGDPLARLIVERIALNAREVGLQVQTVPASGSTTNSDLRMTRILLRSPDPALALGEIAGATGLNFQLNGSSVEDIYSGEKRLLTGSSVIPLFHMPIASITGDRVRNWPEDKLGRWPLADVSLDGAGDPQRP